MASENLDHANRNDYNLFRNLPKNNSKNIQTDLISMDFAKTFDKVPHRRLLYKLQYYGVQENSQLWIQTFPSDLAQMEYLPIQLVS